MAHGEARTEVRSWKPIRRRARIRAAAPPGKQARKGKNVPCAAHLLGTAGIVLAFAGDEAQAIAALLHDAAEDHGGRERSGIPPSYNP